MQMAFSSFRLDCSCVVIGVSLDKEPGANYDCTIKDEEDTQDFKRSHFQKACYIFERWFHDILPCGFQSDEVYFR